MCVCVCVGVYTLAHIFFFFFCRRYLFLSVPAEYFSCYRSFHTYHVFVSLASCLVSPCAQFTDLRGFLRSHSDIACLLIQSNFTELQRPVNILIRIRWLSYHPLQYQGHKRKCEISQNNDKIFQYLSKIFTINCWLMGQTCWMKLLQTFTVLYSTENCSSQVAQEWK
jgi:hypothetical protein